MTAVLAAPRRVLVRLPNWLGDVMMARPLLHALRHAHPAARIEVIGPPELIVLFEHEPFDEYLRSWTPIGALPPTPGADAAVILPPSFSSAWAALRWGARARLGFASDGRSLLLTHPWRRPARGEMHLSREYLALAAPLGVSEVPVPPLSLPEETRAWGRSLLERTGGVPERWVVIGPGAIYGPAKRWPAARFAALAGRLAGTGLEVLVCGAASDRAAADEVTRMAGPGVRSLAGETTLGVQLALCAGAVATVCNDSGLAHVAAATGARTVVVFGSTSSAWTAPIGDDVRVVQHAPVCAPCFRRTCRIGYRCLEAVTVEEVARCVAA
ncbi:MAG: lipopolysaccharide heptosyltransferase II [Candidatus Eisenbacteria bacterium]